tara:strand:+ start:630 stop:941 length:312 start_codon:yes stop_codon:yes gene_type:complete
MEEYNTDSWWNHFCKDKIKNMGDTTIEYQITYTNMDDTTDTVKISTDRIEWTLDQYQRNRDIRSYDLITHQRWDGIQYVTETYIPKSESENLFEESSEDPRFS